MSQKCELTGVGPMVGNKRSHSNMKSKKRSMPNLMKCRIWDPVAKKTVTVRVTARAKRTINKLGFSAAMAKAGC